MKKYKKGLWAAFAVAALASAFAFGGCTGTEAEHKHEWNDWRVTTPATCTTAGEKVRTCKTDSTHKETEVIPATGHSYATGDNWTVDVAPTCQTKGSKSHHCTHDGCSEKADVTEMPVDPDAHKWATDWTVDKDPTCTEKGSQSHHCTVAGCTAKKDDTPVDIDPDAHEWADTWTVDVAPTCQTKGSKSHHCKHAGCTEKHDVTEVDIDPDAHEWATAWTVDVASTCVAKGSKSHHCLHTGCTEKHDVTEVDIDPDAHDYATGDDWTVDTPATCTADGSKSHHCKHAGCTAKKDDTVIAAGDGTHVYSEEFTVDKEPTCTDKGSKSHHCTKCDAKKDITEIDELGHNFATGDNWTVDKAATCTEAGSKSHHCSRCDATTDVTAIEIDPDAHAFATGDDWTVDKAATCTEAGSRSHHCTREGCDVKTDVTEIEALGHNPTAHPATESTCTVKGHDAYWECETCHKLFSDEALATEIDAVVEHDLVAHKYEYSKSYHGKKNPTCTEDGYNMHYTCAVCDAKFKNYNYSSQTCTDPISDEEWNTKYLLKAHSATLQTRTKADATCKKEGYNETHYYCTKCKQSSMTKDFAVILTEEEAVALVIPIDLTKHNLTHTDAKDSTCAATGNIEYWRCSVCYKYYLDAEATNESTSADITVAKKPHAHIEKVERVEPTCTTDGNIEYWHCSDCNKNYTSEAGTSVASNITLKALGHKREYTVTTVPTQTESGLATGTCTVCHDVSEQTLMAISSGVYTCTVDVPNTCHTAGSAIYSAKYADGTVSFTVELAPINHANKKAVAAQSGTASNKGLYALTLGANTAEYKNYEAYWYCPDCDAAYSDEACTKTDVHYTHSRNGLLIDVGEYDLTNVANIRYFTLYAPYTAKYTVTYSAETNQIIYFAKGKAQVAIYSGGSWVTAAEECALFENTDVAPNVTITVSLKAGDAVLVGAKAALTQVTSTSDAEFMHYGDNTANITVENSVEDIDVYAFVPETTGTYSLLIPAGYSAAMNGAPFIDNGGTAMNFDAKKGEIIEFSFSSGTVGSFTATIGEAVFPVINLGTTMTLDLPAKVVNAGVVTSGVTVLKVGDIEEGTYTITVSRIPGNLMRGAVLLFGKNINADYTEIYGTNSKNGTAEVYVQFPQAGTLNGADYQTSISGTTWTITLTLKKGDLLVFCNGGTTSGQAQILIAAA